MIAGWVIPAAEDGKVAMLFQYAWHAEQGTQLYVLSKIYRACSQDGSYQLLHAEDGGSAPLQHNFAGSTAAKSLGKDPLVSLSWTAHDPSSRRHTTRVPLFESSGSTRVCPGQPTYPQSCRTMHVLIM